MCVCVNISVFLGEYIETEIHMSILGDWITIFICEHDEE